MLTYHGGTRVKYGYYWNLSKWEIVTVPKEGRGLPEGPAERYLRVPIALLLVLAPVMGGLYVVFLPFIGFFMILRFAGLKAAEGLRRAFMELLTTLSPAWQPGEAYFAGKRKGREDEGRGTPAEPEAPERSAREIEARPRTEG